VFDGNGIKKRIFYSSSSPPGSRRTLMVKPTGEQGTRHMKPVRVTGSGESGKQHYYGLNVINYTILKLKSDD